MNITDKATAITNAIASDETLITLIRHLIVIHLPNVSEPHLDALMEELNLEVDADTDTGDTTTYTPESTS